MPVQGHYIFGHKHWILQQRYVIVIDIHHITSHCAAGHSLLLNSTILIPFARGLLSDTVL